MNCLLALAASSSVATVRALIAKWYNTVILLHLKTIHVLNEKKKYSAVDATALNFAAISSYCEILWTLQLMSFVIQSTTCRSKNLILILQFDFFGMKKKLVYVIKSLQYCFEPFQQLFWFTQYDYVIYCFFNLYFLNFFQVILNIDDNTEHTFLSLNLQQTCETSTISH